ncbi:MAG: hypothetical protein ABW217_17845 [Polyangiaceae bacterium]
MLALVGLTAFIAYAGARQLPKMVRASSSVPEPSKVAPAEPRRARSAVQTVYESDSSAYHVRLLPHEEGAILVAADGFTMLRTGRPPEEHTLSLGSVVARQGDSLVFWRHGELRQVSLSGGHEHELVTSQRSPQYLLASETQLAWIDGDRDEGFALRALTEGGARLVHHFDDSIGAAVLHDTDVYVLLQGSGGSWSIGVVPLGGRAPRFTQTRAGRPPAMLAPGPAGVYFYAGPERGVRALSFDLEHEAPVMANVICSPLAVSASDRVICAQVGGVFDIRASRGRPRFLAAEPGGPVTSIVAGEGRAFWVAEAGDHRLAVRSVELPL